MIPSLDVFELKEKMDANEAFVLLDVREPHEHQRCRIRYGESPLIPLGELEGRLSELNTELTYVCYCRSGGRSAKATQLMMSYGYDVENLDGGILSWADEIDSSIEKY